MPRSRTHIEDMTGSQRRTAAAPASRSSRRRAITTRSPAIESVIATPVENASTRTSPKPTRCRAMAESRSASAEGHGVSPDEAPSARSARRPSGDSHRVSMGVRVPGRHRRSPPATASRAGRRRGPRRRPRRPSARPRRRRSEPTVRSTASAKQPTRRRRPYGRPSPRRRRGRRGRRGRAARRGRRRPCALPWPGERAWAAPRANASPRAIAENVRASAARRIADARRASPGSTFMGGSGRSGEVSVSTLAGAAGTPGARRSVKDEAGLVDARRSARGGVRVREDVRGASARSRGDGRVGRFFGGHLAPPRSLCEHRLDDAHANVPRRAAVRGRLGSVGQDVGRDAQRREAALSRRHLEAAAGDAEGRLRRRRSRRSRRRQSAGGAGRGRPVARRG